MSLESDLRTIIAEHLASPKPGGKEEILEKLGELREHVGEELLVIEQRVKRPSGCDHSHVHRGGCGGIIPPPEPRHFITNERYFLGIIAPDISVTLHSFDVDFPVERHVTFSRRTHRHHRAWEFVEQPIHLDSTYFFGVGKDPSELDDYQNASRILIGEDVRGHFEKRLGLPFYVEGLRLLEHPISEDLEQAYADHHHEKVVDVVKQLERLLDCEITLKRGIQFVYDSIGHGGFMSGGALSIVEDEHDAHVVSIRDRRQLDETQSNIRTQLGKAIELGMHDASLTLPGNRTGKFFDVPTYIDALCRVYNVEIPAATSEAQ
jgi:hypothetical protein